MNVYLYDTFRSVFESCRPHTCNCSYSFIVCKGLHIMVCLPTDNYCFSQFLDSFSSQITAHFIIFTFLNTNVQMLGVTDRSTMPKLKFCIHFSLPVHSVPLKRSGIWLQQIRDYIDISWILLQF